MRDQLIQEVELECFEAFDEVCDWGGFLRGNLLHTNATFERLFAKVEKLDPEAFKTLLYLKSAKGCLEPHEISAIKRELDGKFVYADAKALVKRECTDGLNELASGSNAPKDTVALADKTQINDMMNFQRQSNYKSACLNCGNEGHWLDACKKPISNLVQNLRAEVRKTKNKTPKGTGKKGKRDSANVAEEASKAADKAAKDAAAKA